MIARTISRPALLLMAACALWAGPAGAQVKDWPSERPPRALPAHPVTFPPYAVRTLPNGLQVIAVSHHEQPAVSLRLIVRAGSAQDPADRPGLASLAATLLDQGTTTKSAEQIATTIDSIGGALGTGASADFSSINCIVMKDSLDVGLDLVSDLAQHPAFANEEIDRQRSQILSGLKVSYDDPGYLADMVFDRIVYGFHPYGRPQNGTPESLAAITRADLTAFHRVWFGANNAILAVVGDVEPDVAFAGAARAFGSWARAESEAPAFMPPPPATRRVVVVDRPGAVQTEIRVGNIGIPRRNKDYMALDLAIKILGGEGANRLHRVLRTERGLTYGTSADSHTLREGGDIVAETNTRSETTGETLRLMVDEFWKLLRDRVNDRELGDAQAYQTGSFPLTIETPSQIALQVLHAVFYGLDLNDLQTYRERVNAISADDVQRVARQYLHPDRLTIVLVGDASAIAKQLPAAGFDRFEQIAVADLDLSSSDLRRKSSVVGDGAVRPAAYVQRAPAPAPDSAKAVLDRMVAAKGGVERLRQIRTVRAESVTQVRTDTGLVQVPTVTSIQYPGKFRVEAQLPAGKVVQVYADGRYWIEDARGARDAPVSVRDEIHASVQRDLVPLLLRAVAGDLRASTASSGDPALVAIALDSAGMRPITLYVDRRTGLVARETYAESGDDVTTEEFSDYRGVDGLQVAFRATVRRPGAPVIERLLQRIRYNVPLDAALFARSS